MNVSETWHNSFGIEPLSKYVPIFILSFSNLTFEERLSLCDCVKHLAGAAAQTSFSDKSTIVCFYKTFVAQIFLDTYQTQIQMQRQIDLHRLLQQNYCGENLKACFAVERFIQSSPS